MTLLVIDTQKGITDSRLYGFEALRTNIKALIAQARAAGAEVIYVRHDDGPGTGFSVGDDEFQIFEEFAPLEGERIFDKRVNSALHPSVGLSAYLAEHAPGLKCVEPRQDAAAGAALLALELAAGKEQA